MVEQDLLMAYRIAERAAEIGGRVYFIGGCVRDKLRHCETKDIDIEVHGLRPSELEAILDRLGERIAIGESFGIYNLKGCSLDIAMPRREENRGLGHRDFDVFVDPFIGTFKAAERRDFTVNALMENVLTGEIIDHFHGLEDLQAGVIRHINDATFREDPLRVLRGAQFAARFEYTIAEETIRLCSEMDLSALPKERVMGELEKALLKADRPSIFFESLRSMHQLSFWFPELEQTIGVEQDPRFHPEGDVWTHTMIVLDAAAAVREKAKDPLAFMLAALTHDLGKVITTEFVKGAIHAYRHETEGQPLIKAFIKRLTAEKDLLRTVQNLTKLHMKPHMIAASRSAVKATNRMFDQASDPEGLLLLALADGLGKDDPKEGEQPEKDFLFERLEVYRETMKQPHVMGRDLIEAGLKPSERFTEYLAFAHKLRLAGVDKDTALRQTLALARKSGDIPKTQEK